MLVPFWHNTCCSDICLMKHEMQQVGLRHRLSAALCQNRGNRFLWHNFVPKSAFCAKMAQRFQFGRRSALWLSYSSGHRPRRLWAGSVPKSRKSLPMAQFCAIIGVLSKNGTEISIQGEFGALAVKLVQEPTSESLCQNRGNRILWHNFVP